MAEHLYRAARTGILWRIDPAHPARDRDQQRLFEEQIAQGHLIDLGPADQATEAGEEF